jgi:hypothetical protein
MINATFLAVAGASVAAGALGAQAASIEMRSKTETNVKSFFIFLLLNIVKWNVMQNMRMQALFGYPVTS